MNFREAARDQDCIRCDKNDGTVVLAHYFGPRRHEFGGGMGHKGHDLVGAALCAACHKFMDTESRDKQNKWTHSEEFLFLVCKTLLRLYEQGRLVVK